MSIPITCLNNYKLKIKQNNGKILLKYIIQITYLIQRNNSDIQDRNKNWLQNIGKNMVWRDIAINENHMKKRYLNSNYKF